HVVGGRRAILHGRLVAAPAVVIRVEVPRDEVDLGVLRIDQLVAVVVDVIAPDLVGARVDAIVPVVAIAAVVDVAGGRDAGGDRLALDAPAVAVVVLVPAEPGVLAAV